MPEFKPKALHFGAGNIGRGFIGPLLSESGYHVVFTDVDSGVINELNDRDSYDVVYLEKRTRRQSVTSVSGVLSNGDDVITYFTDTNVRLITTAVGPNILEKIAPTIAKGLQARRRADAGTLTVIACENMVEQTAHLAHHVSQHLSSEDLPWVEEYVSFANCSVDRIVPPSEMEDNPLDVGVEEFYEWVVDETALKSSLQPAVKGMTLTENLSAYIERKIFTLNCGHAMAAYLGFIKGYNTVDIAILDPEIRKVVLGALEEGGSALIQKYGFKPAEHEAYIQKTIKRFENPKLKDDVARVGRQPLRKLGRKDRLCGPAYMAIGYGLPFDNLARGMAAALLYDSKDDTQSVEMQAKIKEMGLEKAIEEIIGFTVGSEEHKKVLGAYHDLMSGSPLAHL